LVYHDLYDGLLAPIGFPTVFCHPKAKRETLMVKIVTDSTAGLTAETARRYDIPVIPQVIIFGTDSYLEGIEIDNANFMQRLKNSRELPKTAAPPPELFVEQFKRLVPQGEPIVCIHPSAEVSGTVRSATMAARNFPDADIRVIDTRFIASPLATMVSLAAQWAEAGEDVDSIEARLRNQLIPRCRLYFMVATLEYLARGGRIGGAAALLGSVLQVKPILTFKDGQVNQFERERTHRRGLARLKQLVLEQIARDDTGYLSVMHAGVPEQGQALADDLADRLGLSDVPILDVPPAITTHGGPGILGVGFFVGI
jgi:DegV family protein with EDD domain